jgi:hypothetical protein
MPFVGMDVPRRTRHGLKIDRSRSKIARGTKKSPQLFDDLAESLEGHLAMQAIVQKNHRFPSARIESGE